jgi:hypothetical protein
VPVRSFIFVKPVSLFSLDSEPYPYVLLFFFFFRNSILCRYFAATKKQKEAKGWPGPVFANQMGLGWTKVSLKVSFLGEKS